eukprot:scaffold78610_cov40-Phaeocystis_antarctica.AAC.1
MAAAPRPPRPGRGRPEWRNLAGWRVTGWQEGPHRRRRRAATARVFGAANNHSRRPWQVGLCDDNRRLVAVCQRLTLERRLLLHQGRRHGGDALGCGHRGLRQAGCEGGGVPRARARPDAVPAEDQPPSQGIEYLPGDDASSAMMNKRLSKESSRSNSV